MADGAPRSLITKPRIVAPTATGTAVVKQRALPGFAFCRNFETDVPVQSYLRTHKENMMELFTKVDPNHSREWQKEVLEGVLKDNADGFFAADLSILAFLLRELKRLLGLGVPFEDYVRGIIKICTLPFKKEKDGDDRKYFGDIGDVFKAICAFLSTPDITIQSEVATAAHYFAARSGSLSVRGDSTLQDKIPVAPDLFGFVRTALQSAAVTVALVVEAQPFIESLSSRGDVATIEVVVSIFEAMFEFSVRGLASSVPKGFVGAVVNFLHLTAEFAQVRVLAKGLAFLVALVQESSDALMAVDSRVVWKLFTDLLFNSFQANRREVRNEVLSLIGRLAEGGNCSKPERVLDFCQTLAMLKPDTKTTIDGRSLRFSHEEVDIEMVVLAQDVALALHAAAGCHEARPEFIEHQIHVLIGDVNHHFQPVAGTLLSQALWLLTAYANDPVQFTLCRGPEIIAELLIDGIEVEAALCLPLKFPVQFADVRFIQVLWSFAFGEGVASSVRVRALTVLARMLDGEPEVAKFIEDGGVKELIDRMVGSDTDVALAAADCARSVSRVSGFEDRQAYQLLDRADSAPPVLRCALLGLFLDLWHYDSFQQAARSWRSLRDGCTLQRAVVRWWLEEDARVGIRTEEGIISDVDWPLKGNTLTSPFVRKERHDLDALIDPWAVPNPTHPYASGLRARLHLLMILLPPLEPEATPQEKMTALVVREALKLREGEVWRELSAALSARHVKGLHADKERMRAEMAKGRAHALRIQSQQCQIYEEFCEAELAREKEIYAQLEEGLKTAEFVAENFKAILASQVASQARPYQGRTVKAEDVLVRSGTVATDDTVREVVKAEVEAEGDQAARAQREREELYIRQCLEDDAVARIAELTRGTVQAAGVVLNC